MAKVKDITFPTTHGKLAKDGDLVYRTRNGKQHSYQMKPNSVPPSKAQKAHRSLFGKTTAVVNAIMADPAQTAEWEEKRRAYNNSLPFDPAYKRFKTPRSFAHFVISKQLEQQAATRRRKPIPHALPKGFRLHVKHFAELKNTELYAILKTRQGCFEIDGVDPRSVHLALFHGGKVIAYARIRKMRSAASWLLDCLLYDDSFPEYREYIQEQAEEAAKRLGATELKTSLL